MFSTLKTLFDGANARADDRLKDAYAVELIEQPLAKPKGTWAPQR